MSEFRNLIVAVALSSSIMLGWNLVTSHYYKPDKTNISGVLSQESPEINNDKPQDPSLASVHFKNREDIIHATESDRVQLSNQYVSGTIYLKGAKIDDLKLLKYRDKAGASSPNVVLLSPDTTKSEYFAEFGWNTSSKNVDVPDRDSMWKVEGISHDGKELHMTWVNRQGILFGLRISLDERYMFGVSQYIKNNSKADVSVVPYAKINRLHDGHSSYWISHEGLIAVAGSHVKEVSYDDMLSDGLIDVSLNSSNGHKSWFGFSDKYWFTAIIPFAEEDVSVRVLGAQNGALKRFQASFSFSDERVVHSGSQIDTKYMFFAGAKELSLLDDYKKKFSISLFDKAVDFGSLYFITKPVFLLLQYINSVVGNFGYAILCLTFVVKAFMVPFAYRSHFSVMKIKSLSPEMERIRAVNAGNSAKINSEIASLFAKNSVSPVSGFLPVLVQVPFFFALYKVLFVTIEMRHANFILWIRDLSSADPMNILNLFGLIDYSPPVALGVLPVVLGLTMILQQKVTESVGTAAVDKNQAALMKAIPYVFMFVFSSFPAGLVIYWIFSNVITMLQQLIMNRIYGKKYAAVTEDISCRVGVNAKKA